MGRKQTNKPILFCNMYQLSISQFWNLVGYVHQFYHCPLLFRNEQHFPPMYFCILLIKLVVLVSAYIGSVTLSVIWAYKGLQHDRVLKMLCNNSKKKKIKNIIYYRFTVWSQVLSLSMEFSFQIGYALKHTGLFSDISFLHANVNFVHRSLFSPKISSYIKMPSSFQ